MIVRVSQVKVRLAEAEMPLVQVAARALGLLPEDIVHVSLFRKSTDARDKGDVHFSLTLDVELRHVPAWLQGDAARGNGEETAGQAHTSDRSQGNAAKGSGAEKGGRSRTSVRARGRVEILQEAEAAPAVPKLPVRRVRPIVTGMGPAGLFAALRLAQAGLAPLVIERGRDVERRVADVEAFRCDGSFDPCSNVQFGEGGAGTFSDGKLNSGTRSPYHREILETFHRMGAPEEILWSARPHIGSDNLRRVVRKLRGEILRLGGEVRLEAKLEELRIEGGRLRGARINGEWTEAEALILAIGHSARDTFAMLQRSGLVLVRKPFSLGARIEHEQRKIDRAQYGAAAGHPALGAADYRLSCHLPDGRAAYTFCMCPGGEVVAAASEEGGVVVNGMSLFARDGANANSALLVSVQPEDFGGDDPLAGVRFQQRWERAAFRAGGGGYRAPAQTVGDFLAGKASTGPGDVEPSYRPGVRWTSLEGCLPDYVLRDMRAAIGLFDRKLRGFAEPGAVLTGVETRSSSPLRICRDETLQAICARGLYPCGEGAGYAGGILSAAADGLRCADALIGEWKGSR